MIDIEEDRGTFPIHLTLRKRGRCRRMACTVLFSLMYTHQKSRGLCASGSLYACTICLPQSMHMMRTFFVALTLFPQQGQTYLRWWLLVVGAVSASPPAILPLPAPRGVKLHSMRFIWISVQPWSRMNSQRASVGWVMLHPIRGS